MGTHVLACRALLSLFPLVPVTVDGQSALRSSQGKYFSVLMFSKDKSGREESTVALDLNARAFWQVEYAVTDSEMLVFLPVLFHICLTEGLC